MVTFRENNCREMRRSERFYIFCLFAIYFFLLLEIDVKAADHVPSFPLISIDNFHFTGAFRLPAATVGASSLNYAQGPLAYHSDTNTLYIVGHSHDQAIAQFSIPSIIHSDVITELEMATEPIQPFIQLLDNAPTGNPQHIDRIGGMAIIETEKGASLWINGYEYYDADNSVTQSTIIAQSAEQLESSIIDGFYRFEGGAGHTAGWLSPIPSAWQRALGGRYLTGDSSGIPIISRSTVGPSAFSFDPSTIGETAEPIKTNRLLDFSLDSPLHTDLYNESKSNDLWTHLSRAVYGFIIPETATYVTIGYTGGHESGVCYKCTQDNGHLCGGYCTPDSQDNYPYYWLWDVNHLVDASNGLIEASQIKPYEYGRFHLPFPAEQIGGGSYDHDSRLLYLTAQQADDKQGDYMNPPLVLVYAFNQEANDRPLAIDMQTKSVTTDLTFRTLSFVAVMMGGIWIIITRNKFNNR